MKLSNLASPVAVRQGTKFALVLTMLTVMTGFVALPAFALLNPIPIARSAVRLKMNQEEPARHAIRFRSERVRSGSGHTRFVSGGGTFVGRRGLRHFTYSVNVDTGNGAVNGVKYSVR